MPFASTVWSFGNQGYAIRIWYEGLVFGSETKNEPGKTWPTPFSTRRPLSLPPGSTTTPCKACCTTTAMKPPPLPTRAARRVINHLLSVQILRQHFVAQDIAHLAQQQAQALSWANQVDPTMAF